jgi:hypothetical protein
LICSVLNQLIPSMQEHSSISRLNGLPTPNGVEKSGLSKQDNCTAVQSNYALTRPRFFEGHRSHLEQGLYGDLDERKSRARRTHTKSRQGCFGCKKRKIKVSELAPYSNWFLIVVSVRKHYQPASIASGKDSRAHIPSLTYRHVIWEAPKFRSSLRRLRSSAWLICDYFTISSSTLIHIFQSVMTRCGSAACQLWHIRFVSRF